MTVVSVVTPFYNTADYLAECIESVLAQSLGDFEYVLLDNASTDGSGEIARGYARRDARLRVHRNDTLLPQVPNYNRAVSLIAAETRYCKIVQADDKLFPRCLEEMVALADKHLSVGLVGSYFHYGKIEPADLPPTEQVLTGREACRRQLLEGSFLFGSPTTLLFRADVVRARKPFYEEGRLFEDTEACFEILRDHDFGFVPQLLTFSRVDPGSLMGKMLPLNGHLLDRLIRLKRFGPEYLTAEEYALHFGQHQRRYRHMLADAWMRGREPAFWEFHRRGLATIGEDIHRKDLVRDAAGVVARSVLGAIVRRVRRKPPL